MSDTNLNLSTSQRLQPFLILAKSVKGAAIGKLIMDALAAPGVYVFSELYQAPSVVEAANHEDVVRYIDLLRIFMYGTISDYTEQASRLPKLNGAQLTKLKHLSIVTLAERCRTLPYAPLQEYLRVDSVRQLEDLIIDAFYQGILRGKLDQRHQLLEIEFALGRDLRPEQLGQTIDTLAQWTLVSETVLSTIDNRIQAIQDTMNQVLWQRTDHDQKVEQLRQEVKQKKELSMGSSSGPATTAGVRTRRTPASDHMMTEDEHTFPHGPERGGRAKKSRGMKRYMVGHQ